MNNQPKILIIDDDDLVCISLKKLLIKLGYEVEICLEGKDAVDKVKEFEPDLPDYTQRSRPSQNFPEKIFPHTCDNDYGILRR